MNNQQHPQQLHPIRPKIKIFEYQVGGRTLLLRSADNTRVYKRLLNPKQPQFYSYIRFQHASHPHYQLLHFMPVCYGIVDRELDIDFCAGDLNRVQQKMGDWYEEIRGSKRNRGMGGQQMFMEMGNFSHAYGMLNLIDIKIGKMPRKTYNPFCIKKNLKINGILKTFSNGEVQFATRVQAGSIVCQDTLRQVLAYFFIPAPNTLLTHLLQSFISRLQDLSLVIRSFRGWSLNSASICMLYDASDPGKWDLKIIDFSRVECKGLGDQEYDGFFVNGLENLIRYLGEIVKEPEKFRENKVSYKYDTNYYVEEEGDAAY